jgi:putative PIN family toxin of toxin-antitoxin system
LPEVRRKAGVGQPTDIREAIQRIASFVMLPVHLVAHWNGIIYDTVMDCLVFDTSIWIAGLRSKRGAAYHLLTLIGTDQFELAVSVPLIFEYEAVAKRHSADLHLSDTDIDNILDYICSVSIHQQISFLWRPLLRDPDDDMVLELAVSAQASIIVTFNAKDFWGAEQFGINVMTPRDYLDALRRK